MNAPLNFDAIPQELRDRRQWVAWRRVDRPDSKKPTKVPIQPHSGAPASTTDPATWNTFNAALAAHETDPAAGIGFVFTQDDPYVGVDLDGCRDAVSGVIEPWAQKILAELNSYTEISPSGTGLHIIVRAKLPPGGRRRGQIEMYEVGRYFTMTGHVLEDGATEIREATNSVAAIHEKIWGHQDAPSPNVQKAPPAEEIITLLRDEPEFGQLMRGDWTDRYPSQSEADLALCSLICHRLSPDPQTIDGIFRRSGLMRPKWDEQRGTETYGQRTIQKALSGNAGGHGRPLIVCTNRPHDEIVGDAVNALCQRNDPPRLFVRHGHLVRLRSDEQERPMLDVVDDPQLRFELAGAADWVTIGKRGIRTHIPPPATVVASARSQGRWPFPPLAGVVEHPILRTDGSVATESGYDAVSGFVCCMPPGMDSVTIPDRPDAGAVASARAHLKEIVADFPFVDRASAANALALLLTPVLRPAIDGPVPIAVIDKPQAGTGASLLADCVGMIATRVPTGAMTTPKNDEEARKRITAMLLADTAVACLDNVDSHFESDSLAAVLSARTWKDRRLGHSEMVEVPVRTTWILTANNVELDGALPRRSYWIRLDARRARPWMRTGFTHPQLLGWILRRRASLLGAIFTLVRAWFQQDCPAGSHPIIGGFELWSSMAGGILSTAAVSDFLGNLTDMYDRIDPSAHEWEAFLTTVRKVLGAAPFTTATLAANIDRIEGLRDVLPSVLALPPSHSSAGFKMHLGRALAEQDGHRYNATGLRIERAGDDGHNKVARWRVIADDADAGVAGSDL